MSPLPMDVEGKAYAEDTADATTTVEGVAQAAALDP